jgi:hypothetical protein
MLALTVALYSQPSYAQKAGVASAVRNDVSGILGASTRKLGAGASVFSNELIRTGDASIAQLTFLDETTLSVAAKSEVRITRFVYDPSRPSASKVISASKGALRFVSGSSNPSSYKIETPSASIGVRGTIIDLLIFANYMTAILVEGWFTALARATGISYTIKIPGQALTIFLNGQASQTTWQWNIYNFVGHASFPLFGDNIAPNQTFIPPNDTQRSLVDQVTPRLFFEAPRQQPCMFCNGKGG